MKILVAGATGYIGSHLIPALLAKGHSVRGLVHRNSAGLPQGVDAVQGDLLRLETVGDVMRGADVAYYLVHSMRAGEQGFAQRDRVAAFNFATSARANGVRKVIYLGGLGSASLSKHLASRQETGAVLAAYGPPTLEFRAGIVVGTGSASFEIIRDLAEKLPMMICPAWVTQRVQPIAIQDVVSYLVGVLDQPSLGGGIVEIGGGSIETYRSMILGYAAVRGLRRRLFQVPVLTPRLSSYWLDLVTDVPHGITRPLIEGLRSEVVCSNGLASRLFPHVSPMDYHSALREALHRPDPGYFTDELALKRTAAVSRQGLVSDCRRREVHAPVEVVRAVVHRLGGEHGWPYADWLWRLRGLVDRVIGGDGMRPDRERRLPLHAGDTLDFWRVQQSTSDRLLLKAEMKVPGKAWLQFQFRRLDDLRTDLRMIASFEPRGGFGFTYWWVLYPLHAVIFNGMLKAIAKLSERNFTAQQFMPTIRSKPASHLTFHG
jgi:uncharacterized protein YbjT (DUF2867 family)